MGGGWRLTSGRVAVDLSNLFQMRLFARRAALSQSRMLSVCRTKLRSHFSLWNSQGVRVSTDKLKVLRIKCFHKFYPILFAAFPESSI